MTSPLRDRDRPPPGFPLPPGRFTGAAREVPAMRAFDWLGEGWALFLGAPRLWLILSGGVFLAFLASDLLWLFVRTGFEPSWPRSVVLAVVFLAPVLMMPLVVGAGLQICRLLARGETPTADDLRRGLTLAPRALFQSGLLCLVGWLAIYALHATIVGPLAYFLPTLAGFAFLIAIWFIPPLVAFHGLSPVAAMTRGFAACYKSAGTFALFGFTMAVLHLVALLPAALGLILLLPVAIGALHSSYRDVFSES